MICKLFFFIKIKRYAADLKSADPYQVVGVQVPLRAPARIISGHLALSPGRETLRDRRGGLRASSKRERKVYPTETVWPIQNARASKASHLLHIFMSNHRLFLC
jgi:hypothetical protein